MAEDAPLPTGPRVSFMRRITGMAGRAAVHQPKSPPSGPRYDTATGRRLDKPPPKNPIRRRISTMLGLAPPVDPYAVGFESEGISAKQYMKEGDVGLYTVANVRARQGFRHDPDVAGWLTRFYETFVTVDEYGFVAREEVLAVQVKMCKALFKTAEFDWAEVAEAAEADWEREVAIAAKQKVR